MVPSRTGSWSDVRPDGRLAAADEEGLQDLEEEDQGKVGDGERGEEAEGGAPAAPHPGPARLGTTR